METGGDLLREERVSGAYFGGELKLSQKKSFL